MHAFTMLYLPSSKPYPPSSFSEEDECDNLPPLWYHIMFYVGRDDNIPIPSICYHTAPSHMYTRRRGFFGSTLSTKLLINQHQPINHTILHSSQDADGRNEYSSQDADEYNDHAFHIIVEVSPQDFSSILRYQES